MRLTKDIASIERDTPHNDWACRATASYVDGDGNLDELTCKKDLWTHSSDALVRRCSIDEGCQPIRLDKRVAVHKSDVIDAIEITHRHVVSGESKILPISNCCDGRESSLNLFKTSVG
ncbi:unannotated protein [freshwater metagenome]|uniref:Unannotated protein n=1 Tax=freshwater metagenome TaxID=449393 RepID=A0A6J7K0Q3_9ZZZZ